MHATSAAIDAECMLRESYPQPSSVNMWGVLPVTRYEVGENALIESIVTAPAPQSTLCKPLLFPFSWSRDHPLSMHHGLLTMSTKPEVDHAIGDLLC